ncbi:amidohydrolase family protein [Candidatus Micrarchaeota archaeon]|nr:amidohydrolase family protein [Candidatus Micrarchaeota archaeon]
MALLLKNANVVDVEAGVANNGNVLLDGGKIVDTTINAVEGGMRVFDCRGGFLVPGFADAHVHIGLEPDWRNKEAKLPLDKQYNTGRISRNVDSALDYGITLMRDVGSPGVWGFKAREQLEKRGRSRLAVAGRLLTNGHAKELGVLVQGRDLPKAAMVEIGRGADVIKVASNKTSISEKAVHEPYTVQELRKLVKTCEKHGRKVAGHAHEPELIERALRAGVHTLEHSWPLDEQMAEQMRRKGIIVVPTYAAAELSRLPEKVSLVPRNVYKAIYLPWLRKLESGIKRAIRCGVTLACGSDAGFVPISFGRYAVGEAQAFERFGAAPQEALKSLTIRGAEACGFQDRLGRIEEGFEADLVLLKANPLRSTSALSKVAAVFSRGRLVR